MSAALSGKVVERVRVAVVTSASVSVVAAAAMAAIVADAFNASAIDGGDASVVGPLVVFVPALLVLLFVVDDVAVDGRGSWTGGVVDLQALGGRVIGMSSFFE